MSGINWLQPRDHSVAARTVAVLCAVAAAVTIVFAIVDPNWKSDATTIAITVGIAIVVIVGGFLMHLLRPSQTVAWAICPFLAIAIITVLDLLTADGSIAAQVFFFFPALYGASQLHRPAALCVCVATVVGEIIVVATQLPTTAGVVDAVYVSAALLTTVALLVIAGERQDQLVDQLQRQAAIDPLTGLSTRRVLDHAAQSALSGAASDEGTALILLDVDDFKSVNDRYGHPGGDEVLIQLSRLLIDGCRGNDVVSRMGGDEIALLLPGCSEESMIRRADQIMWDVRAHQFLLHDGQELSISVSAGLAHAPTHAGEVRPLYAAADAALYEAKRAGRNRFVAPPSDRIRTS